MRKLLKVLVVIFSILLFKFIFTYTINEIIIDNYNASKYDSKLIKFLYVFNINEPYIVYYNDGNILYRKKKYDEAIKKYDEALEKNVPEKRVCDIRINKSLAMVYKIKSKDKEKIYNELEVAKKNLYEDGCANPNDDNGKSADAEKLEEEIKKLQDELDKENPDDPDNGNDNNEDDTPDVEDIIKERERKANSSRQDDIANSEYIGHYEYYSGKKW